MKKMMAFLSQKFAKNKLLQLYYIYITIVLKLLTFSYKNIKCSKKMQYILFCSKMTQIYKK